MFTVPGDDRVIPKVKNGSALWSRAISVKGSGRRKDSRSALRHTQDLPVAEGTMGVLCKMVDLVCMEGLVLAKKDV